MKHALSIKIPQATMSLVLSVVLSLLLHGLSGFIWQQRQESIVVAKVLPQSIAVALVTLPSVKPAPPQPVEAMPEIKREPVKALPTKVKPTLPPKLKPKDTKPRVPKSVDKVLTPVPTLATEKSSVVTPTVEAPKAIAPPAQKIAPPVLEPIVKAIYASPSLNNPPTHYPPEALRRHWEGVVILDIQVLANGSAGDIKIVSSSGHESLDESALTQVKNWRFMPAHRGNKSVDDWVRVPIKFKFKH
jgi:protein TonB